MHKLAVCFCETEEEHAGFWIAFNKTGNLTFVYSVSFDFVLETLNTHSEKLRLPTCCLSLST